MRESVLRAVAIILCIIEVIGPSLAHAYVGPGAGFAFLGSSLVFLLAIGMGVLTLLFWPLQWAWRKLRGKGIPRHAKTRRVVILGLDGLEPSLVERYMNEGRLPHMKRLAEEGSYRRLGTTLPALSPVAWSTFQTGVNPGAHNIFDFLTRDKRHCMPLLSSTESDPARTLSIGPFKIPLRAPGIRIMRKSKPFWKILGEHGVFSSVIRVPISYPPEPFEGNILSAMCTPDLRGTQGSFTVFTTRERGEADEGGEVHVIKERDGLFECVLRGPPHPKDPAAPALSVTLVLKLDRAAGRALLSIGGETHSLALNEFSDWIEIPFRFGWRGAISGICRFCLREVDPHLTLYVSPINANPEKPAIPIAHPLYFSTWLAKKNGLFGTLGLMEDTWGRNEHALDDTRFLAQTYLTHDERERMFFDALARTREGLCVCVFDASDRIQHMFWRYLDDRHPSPREEIPGMTEVIPEMYAKMDALVGRTMGELREGDVFMVLSDHGFSSFRRGINLNTWLYREGYLALKEGATLGGDYFKDVDWSRTRAFAVGLSGFYINRAGRERLGIVQDDEVDALKAELAAKLEALVDPQDGARVISKVYDTSRTYRGIYAEEAPDLICGYMPGYRVSWDSITGGLEHEVFSDNIKAWSGDHHVDPKLIPGIFFMNRKVAVERPHIMDLAPTTLTLFAVPVPGHMEGKSLI